MKIDTKLHPLTYFNVRNLYEPFKKNLRLNVGGGDLGCKYENGMGLIQYII